MSKEQWGHGYHAGVKAAQKGGLVGSWFHSYKDGKIQWQGQVISQLSPEKYFIRLFSWLDGYPTDKKIIHIDDMEDWTFYSSDYDMRYAYSKKIGKPEYEFYKDEEMKKTMKWAMQ